MNDINGLAVERGVKAPQNAQKRKKARKTREKRKMVGAGPIGSLLSPPHPSQFSQFSQFPQFSKNLKIKNSHDLEIPMSPHPPAPTRKPPSKIPST